MFIAPVVRTRAFAPSSRALDRRFERFLSDTLPQGQRPTEVSQDDTQWTIRLDVPGVTREQLQLNIEGQVVRLTTVADAPRQYQAAYQLPEPIDVAASSAKLEHGVLTLTLGKPQPVNKTTQVTIN